MFNRTLRLFPVLLVLLTAATAFGHTFQLDTSDWDDQPRTVAVAGTFNGWSMNQTPLKRVGEHHYEAEVELSDGMYFYKFVIDGERWINDPTHSDAALEAADGMGGTNSAVLVGFDPRKLPAPEPNAVRKDAVRFDPLNDTRVLADAALFGVSIKAQADDVQRVNVVLIDENNGERRVELPRVDSELGLDRFAGRIEVDREEVRYRIELIDGDATERLGAGGLTDTSGTAEPFVLDVTTGVETPDWAEDAVWYQIFAERFRNGEPGNDPGAYEYENLLPWTIDWWKEYPQFGEVESTRETENFYQGNGNVWQRRFGGDLQGVREKLPYLRELGVNAIYLNPVFEAESMHKYDTADFRHIDDNFGVKSATPTAQVSGETDDPATWQWSASDRVFLDFLDEAHAQGFKVIIDGVFNHVGRAHPFFQDVLAKGKNSKYAEWFDITDWGDPANWREMKDPFEVHGKPGGIQWNAWDQANGHLPTFRKDAELGLAAGPRQHIMDITRRWLAPDGDPSRGIDGWRLDVPQDIPMPFWRDWRIVVKETKPDAYISGEIWDYAGPWLEGDQFDAVMNYQFAMPMRDFFADAREAIPPSTFGQRLTDVAYMYPLEVSLVQMNLLDSHDTDRFASMIVNPDLPYDGANRIQDSGPNYSPRKPTDTEWQRMTQAVTAQMTFLGAPMIYYGDEVGMWSPDDPSDRMPMVWEDLMPYEDAQVQVRRPLFEHYQKLIALREALPVLRHGFYRTVQADDAAGTLVFERYRGGRHVYTVINRSERTQRVSFPVDEATGQGLGYVNLLAPGAVKLTEESGGRPRAELAAGAETLEMDAGMVSLTLPAFGSAVVVERGALGQGGEAEPR